MAGLKTPYALFGAMLGGQLSFHLGPALVDAARCSAQVIAFTVDGLIADTVGRPEVGKVLLRARSPPCFLPLSKGVCRAESLE